MKKNIFNFSFTLLMAFALGACIDDKGNYDYSDADEIFPVQIEGMDEDITVSQGAVLKITPTVVNDDPSRYSYSWIITEKETAGALPKKWIVADTKDLEYTVGLDVNTYLLNFEVYDQAKDVYRRKEITMTVSASPVGAGYYVLKNDGDEADFDFINNSGTIYTNLLKPMGARPKGIAKDMAYQSGRYYHVQYSSEGKATTLINQYAFFITTDQDVRTYNAKTLKLFKTFEDQFYTVPDVVSPVRVVVCNSGNDLIMNNCKVHSIYGMSSNIGKFGAEKVGVYSLYPGIVRAGYSDAIVFDMTDRSFYKASTMTTSLSPIKEVSLDDGSTVSFSKMDYEPLCMEYIDFSWDTRAYIVMKNVNTGAGALARVSGDSENFVSFKSIPSGSHLMEASLLAPSLTSDFLYFATPNSNKVYSYENAEGLQSPEKVILEYPEGETVAYVKHCCYTGKGINKLGVLTNTSKGWKLYLYDLIGESNPEINSEPTAVYEGEGTGRFIMYRQR